MEKAQIFINGIIGKDTTLLDVIRQFKSFDKPTEVEVQINSVGGSVTEGQSIYTYLRGLKLPITTIAEKAYSIAATTFMAGDTRVVLEGPNRIMVHLPLVQNLTANSEVLTLVLGELSNLETEFSAFYSEILDIDLDTISNLLKNETFLNAQEALDLGFATSIQTPLQAVAYFIDGDNQESKKENMSKSNSLLQALKNLVNKAEIVALVIQDANGTEINFPDLEGEAVPQIGDKCEAENGEYTMPSGEVYVIQDGVLTEIKEAQEEEAEQEPTADEIEALFNSLFQKATEQSAKEIAELKAQLVALQKENTALTAEQASLKKLIVSEEIPTNPNPRPNQPRNIFK